MTKIYITEQEEKTQLFCLVIPPICLPLHIIALDYLVAVYPLFLLVCVYVLLTAHDRGCRLVVWLWRPFLWCTTRLRQSWNIRHSIINAFATFLLLSYIKLLNTSCNLLMYTGTYNDCGSGCFLFYDATITFMGSQNKPFAILAILVLVNLLVGILFSTATPAAVSNAVVPCVILAILLLYYVEHKFRKSIIA